MGIAGLVMKPGAGIYGIPAYTMKGLYQEIQKQFGASVNNYLVASRTAQGYTEIVDMSGDERRAVSTRFLEIQYEAKSNNARMNDELAGFRQRWKQRKETKKMIRTSQRKGKQKIGQETGSTEPSDSNPHDIPLNYTSLAPTPAIELPVSDTEATQRIHHAMTYPQPEPRSAHLDRHNSSPLATVHHHYDDDDDDDDNDAELIANAIRASIAEFELPNRAEHNAQEEEDEEAVQQAIAASVAEAAHHRPSDAVDEEAESCELQEVLKKSLQEQRAPILRKRVASLENEQGGLDGENLDSEDDEELKRAVEESKKAHVAHENDDEELKKAVEESKKAHVAHENDDEGLNKAVEESRLAAAKSEEEEERLRKEEDIVMEYLKKQSLIEEEHRRRLLQGRPLERGEGGGEASGT
jgi:hypothetical protein